MLRCVRQENQEKPGKEEWALYLDFSCQRQWTFPRVLAAFLSCRRPGDSEEGGFADCRVVLDGGQHPAVLGAQVAAVRGGQPRGADQRLPGRGFQGGVE